MSAKAMALSEHKFKDDLSQLDYGARLDRARISAEPGIITLVAFRGLPVVGLDCAGVMTEGFVIERPET